MPNEQELCPNGAGIARAENAGLWIDETKATCYANQLDYLDKRPVEEQVQLNGLYDVCIAHGALRISNLKAEHELTHTSKFWAYVMTGTGVALGVLAGMGIQSLR